MAIDLITALMRLGPSKANDIANSFGVSQPTFSRMVSASNRGIVRMGGGKNTHYAASRKVRQLTDDWIPVFRIGEDGQANNVCALRAVHPHGFLMTGNASGWPSAKKGQVYFDSIPYFIQDSKPQGFMGRNFARGYAGVLGVPEDPARWSDDDVMVVMSLLGSDFPGDLIVGEPSWSIFSASHPEAIKPDDIQSAYARLAEEAMAHGYPGSSAAGEFPKFTAVRTHGGEAAHVLVKFSGAGNSPAEIRWADLLRCEAHASDVVRDNLRIDSPCSSAFSFGGRTFMESVRFDRVGLSGRRPSCSFASVDAEFLGMGDPHWDKASEKMLELRLIDRDTAPAMRKLWYFGKLIANSDMHAGNLSFAPNGKGGFKLCPVYDMLPMRYAPARGGEIPVVAEEPVFIPPPGYKSEYREALVAAHEFWGRISSDSEVSQGFREIASTQEAKLKPLGAS